MSADFVSALLFQLLVTVAFIGLVLIVVVCFWRSIAQRVSGTWGKVLVEGVQLLAGSVSIATTFATTKKEVWLPSAVAGAICVVVWKVFQIILDAKAKKIETEKQTLLAEYQRQAINYARLLGVLRTAVNQKIKRLKRMVQKRKKQVRLNSVRDALTPRPHLDELLDGVGAYFCEQLPESDRSAKSFRVGVYVAREGIMTPIHGVSNRDPGFNPFTSFQTHQAPFHLTSVQPSHVVQSVLTKGMIIVEDCAVAANEGTFFYFNAEQRGYLRSGKRHISW